MEFLPNPFNVMFGQTEHPSCTALFKLSITLTCPIKYTYHVPTWFDKETTGKISHFRQANVINHSIELIVYNKRGHDNSSLD